MSIGESIVALIENSNILVVALWVTGMLLFFVEFFQPMRGVAYILGVLLIGAAFVVRMIIGSPGEAFIFVWATAVLMFVLHSVSLFANKRDWLKVARLKKAGERNRRYLSLIDSIGVAITPIDLSGNVTINDVNLAVYSDTPIQKGEKVRVVKVTQDKILVERADVNPDDSEE